MASIANIETNGTASTVQRSSGEHPTIKQFLEAVQRGEDGWTDAGKMLVIMHRHDRHIFAKIMEVKPSLTSWFLQQLMDFGNGVTYPPTATLPPRLRPYFLRVSYAGQKQLLDSPVVVVTRIEGDKPVVIRKPAPSLTITEAATALCSKGNASVAAQVRKLTQLNKLPKALPKTERAPIPTRKKISKGIFAIRKNRAGDWIFEKTAARPYNLQQVMLEIPAGQEAEMPSAVIELCVWEK